MLKRFPLYKRPAVFAAVLAGVFSGGSMVLPAVAMAGEMPDYAVEMKDGVVTPTEIRVKAGTTFRITLKNTGKSAAEFESKRLRKEKVLGPGAESFVVIRKLSPGRYEFFDEFHEDMKSARGVIIAE